MCNMASDKSQDFLTGKVSKAVNARPNIPLNINSKHNKIDCPPNKKIGEGQFGFAFDVIPGQETEAEVLILEWREQKKDNNTLNEKRRKNPVNDKGEQDNSETVKMRRKTNIVKWLM